MTESSTSILESIRELLSRNEVDFREVEHEPTFTSEESAKARGESIRIGGKAILLKVQKEFILFVLPANRKVDSAAVRSYFSIRKLRFATKEELYEQTKLVPGSVPPFGDPIFNLKLYVDEEICQNEMIAFNAGSLTHSIILKVCDYLKCAEPTDLFSFSKPSDISQSE